MQRNDTLAANGWLYHANGWLACYTANIVHTET